MVCTGWLVLPDNSIHPSRIAFVDGFRPFAAAVGGPNGADLRGAVRLAPITGDPFGMMCQFHRWRSCST